MMRNTCTVSLGSASRMRTARKAPRQSFLVLVIAIAWAIAASYLIIVVVRLSDRWTLSRGCSRKRCMEKEKRRYSGQSFEARQSDRRERLVRAALLVAGRFGLEGSSVAAICAEADLTARYFY